jgi:mono/diheme cytochrome c family protein
MLRSTLRMIGLGISLLSLVVVAQGCNRSSGSNAPSPVVQVAPGPNPGPNAAPRGPTPIRDIMVKLARGPASLTGRMTTELEADPIPWDEVQGHAKEYVDLVLLMAEHEPPRGTKESWAKYTDAFAKGAEALSAAAQANDKNAVAAANMALSNSCMACHQQHKGGGPKGGKGGRGGRGGFIAE